MLTLFEPLFAVARSGLPSPFRSSITTDDGADCDPVLNSSCGWNVPSPLPSRMLTLLEPLFAVATSSLPSPFTSAIATDNGWTPTVAGILAHEAGTSHVEHHCTSSKLFPPRPRRTSTMLPS